MLIFIVWYLRFLLFDFQSCLKFLINEQNSLTNISYVHSFELEDETSQKNTTSEFVILTMNVYFMSFTEFQEKMDRIDCDNKFVKRQIRIILKAKMVDLSIFCLFQYFIFQGFRVLILTNVPNLIVRWTNMLLQTLKGLLFWVGNVVKIGNYFSDIELFLNLTFKFVVICWNILNYLCLF